MLQPVPRSALLPLQPETSFPVVSMTFLLPFLTFS
jgi:hypothetical protein